MRHSIYNVNIILNGILMLCLLHKPSKQDLQDIQGHCWRSKDLFISDVLWCISTHGYAHTRGLLWGLPEVVGTVQQVHCSQRRLLRRGLEFHVCTINKSAHTKKSGNLFNDPHIYIYIYIYIYTHTHTHRPRFIRSWV